MPAGKAKECRCFQSPSRYMQGPGLINRLPKFAATFGNTALLIIDPFFYDDFSVRVPKMFEDAGMKAYCVKFPGLRRTQGAGRAGGIRQNAARNPGNLYRHGRRADHGHQQSCSRSLP